MAPTTKDLLVANAGHAIGLHWYIIFLIIYCSTVNYKLSFIPSYERLRDRTPQKKGIGEYIGETLANLTFGNVARTDQRERRNLKRCNNQLKTYTAE